MYKTVNACRACGGEKLVTAFNLGVQPLANDFTQPGQPSLGWAPLEVMFCPECTLAQLSVVVDPKIIYSNYAYVTSKSLTMQEHFERLWAAIVVENFPDKLVEIGSNDGHFLKFCQSKGSSEVVGVDPAKNLMPEGIKSVCRLFDADAAEAVRREIAPDVIVARHVFAHMEDWQAFVRDLRSIMQQETLAVIEVPYVVDMLEGVEFDTIYHEHLSYVSLRAVNHLLDGSGLHIHKVMKFPIHGGAIVIMIRRDDSDFAIDGSVQEFLQQENITKSSWMEFRSEASGKISDLRDSVLSRVQLGAKVCGFGASAKSTVWINACGFTKNEIAFICDCTPQKIGKRSPGSDIPIVSEASLLDEYPDAAVLFAWNFKDEIVRKNAAFIEKGGVFLIPSEVGVVVEPSLVLE